jgi:thiol-disulfide isomerase/thioredoxin
MNKIGDKSDKLWLAGIVVVILIVLIIFQWARSSYKEGSIVCRPDNDYLQNELYPLNVSTHRINDWFPNLIPRPVVSTYKQYDKADTIMTYHFTTWCPACKSFKPHWERLKADPAMANIKFMEFDADTYRFPWVKLLPTLIMYRRGHGYKYTGTPDYESVREFIMTPSFETNGPYYNID